MNKNDSGFTRYIKIKEIGQVCCYCGNDTPEPFTMCCSEVHHEMGYETSDGELILESELKDYHIKDVS